MERDILKNHTVGSTDPRNTNWTTVGLEGDRYGTDGASGLICSPESETLAALETGQLLSEIGRALGKHP